MMPATTRQAEHLAHSRTLLLPFECGEIQWKLALMLFPTSLISLMLSVVLLTPAGGSSIDHRSPPVPT